MSHCNHFLASVTFKITRSLLDVCKSYTTQCQKVFVEFVPFIKLKVSQPIARHNSETILLVFCSVVGVISFVDQVKLLNSLYSFVSAKTFYHRQFWEQFIPTIKISRIMNMQGDQEQNMSKQANNHSRLPYNSRRYTSQNNKMHLNDLLCKSSEPVRNTFH